MSKKYNKKICRFIALSLFFINCLVLNYRSVWADGMVESSLNEIFISEENYADEMQQVVEPYLSNLEENGYIEGQEGIDIFYKKYILEDAVGSIVISHGFTEVIDKYNEIIYYFLKNGYSVFAMEHRGHGRSGYLGKDTSQIYVEDYNYYILDLKKFIDEIVVPDSGDKDLFLFAHSMGGGIAAKFLQDYPQYFDAAVLTGPMMEVNTGSFPKFIARPITWVMANFGLGYLYAAGEKPYTDEYDFEGACTSSEARYSYTYNNITNNELLPRGGASYMWLNESFKLTKEITKKDNAEKIEIPVLLFQAEQDVYVLPGGQNAFASYAKNCELVHIKGAQHEMYRESDEILKPYLEKILNFYKNT